MSGKIDSSNFGYRLAFAALEILRDNDGRMALGDLLDAVGKRKEKEIPKGFKDSYPSGGIKWKMRVQFQANDFVKAGFLRKEKGVWHLTAEGEKAILTGEASAIKTAQNAARQWSKLRKANKQNAAPNSPDKESGDSGDEAPPQENLEQYQSAAIIAVQNYIRSLGPYKFQDLCAALLRGMNYYVRDVSPPGPDGGIDVFAYTDPLGGRPPRLKVQVKHRSGNKVQKSELNELAGLLRDGDIGVFISSSGFAAGCRDEARKNPKHIELIDLPRFIELWQQCYGNLSEEDKSLLPLQPVYFLDEKRATNE